MKSYLQQLDKERKTDTGTKLKFLMIHTDYTRQEKHYILAVYLRNAQVNYRMNYVNMIAVMYVPATGIQKDEN